MAEKGGYKHFMEKEIFEQPRAIIDTFRGRIVEEKGKVFWKIVTLPLRISSKSRRLLLLLAVLHGTLLWWVNL